MKLKVSAHINSARRWLCIACRARPGVQVMAINFAGITIVRIIGKMLKKHYIIIITIIIVVVVVPI